ncbi:hypothetical protein K4F52_010007 [Lecanicillium sp. MT-2017a]|nr:hypothetical protein K4F52_010007 [Lecanicillium sp. MT-2017a]
MAETTSVPSLPPAYETCGSQDNTAHGSDPDPALDPGQGPSSFLDPMSLIDPGTLYVADRFIHCQDPDAPPLYELSHAVDFLRDSDRTVRLERLEYSLKRHRPRDGTNNPPSISTKRRCLYELKHPTPGEYPTFPFHAESASRQSLCTFGLATFRPKRLSSAKGFRVFRAARTAGTTVARRALLFSAVPSKDASVLFDWLGRDGTALAAETDSAGLKSLVIGTRMSLVMHEALVAAWITRIWWRMAHG